MNLSKTKQKIALSILLVVALASAISIAVFVTKLINNDALAVVFCIVFGVL